MPSAPMPAADKVRAIPRGRLVAGMMIHFLAPAYILLLMADATMGRAPATWAAWLPRALGLGGPFLAIYGAASLVLIALAALSDHFGKKRGPHKDAHSPAADSQSDLSQSLAAARGRLGGEVEALLERIATMPLDHHDSQVREIARDIARLLDAERAAYHADAPPQETSRRRTIAALDTLIRALEHKSRESALLARDKAHTLANYVAAKYGEKID